MFKFPYHNPYERIIVVVGSVVVVSLRSWHVFGVGGFLVFPAAGPCVRAIQVQAKRSYDMMNLVLEV